MKRFLKQNAIYFWLGAFGGCLFETPVINLGFWIYILGSIALIELHHKK